MRIDDLLIFMMLDEYKEMYRNVAVRTDSYAERTVPRLSDSSFRQHFSSPLNPSRPHKKVHKPWVRLAARQALGLFT